MILRPLYRGQDLPTSLAVDMNAAAPTGITVPHSTTFDLGNTSFSLPFWGTLDDSTPGVAQWLFLKYQDGATYWGLRVNSGGTLQFVAVVGTVTIITAPSTASIPNGPIFGSVSVTRESALAAGSVVYIVNRSQLGSSVPITAVSPPSISNTGILYLAGSNALGSDMTIRAVYLYNRALLLADINTLEKTGIVAADVAASQTPTYASNFSAGVDGWTGSNMTLVGNVDAILGVNDVLQSTCSLTGTGRYITKTVALTVNLRYRIDISVYFPVANVSADSFFISNQAGSQIAVVLTQNDITKGGWVSFSLEFVAAVAATSLRIYTGTTGSTGATATLNDIMYMSTFSLKRIGNVLRLEPSGLPATDTTWTGTGGTGTLPASGAAKVTVRK